MRRVETSAPGEAEVSRHGDPPLPERAPPPRRAPSSRVDRASEEAALSCLNRGQRDEALKILMYAYGSRITQYAARMLRDRELAKDVRQQVFLKAFQQIDTFERRGTLLSWLCGIAHHRCLDELKRPATTRREPLDTLEDLAGDSALSESPSRIAKQRALERCLGKLQPHLRTQVLMRYFFGLSDAEIGELVGNTPGAVQRRVARILPRLRRCLCDEGGTR